MEKLNALDICCCAGGSSKGLHNAGFTVTGVDIEPQPDYPYTFIQKDFQELDVEWIKKNFNFIWLSPPCPQFSWASAKDRNKGKEYPNLIPQARELADKTGIPYCIENVVGAPIRQDLILCGVMFGLQVIRHRKFELKGFFANQPDHIKHKKPTKHRDLNYYRSKYYEVAGHGGSSPTFKLSDYQKAMGIDWINNVKHLVQAIPPKYSQYIAMQYIDFIDNNMQLTDF